MNEVNGFYIGRFCPTHIAHEVVIRAMIDACGAEHSTIVIGSCNNPMSLRQFFSYEERRQFLKKLFPQITILPLPDFNDDRTWMLALDDLVRATTKKNPEEITFFGGCSEDIRFFEDAGRKTIILNRFDGTTPKISATEVRDALIHDRPLEGLLNPLIMDDVRTVFKNNWELFKKR